VKKLTALLIATSVFLGGYSVTGEEKPVETVVPRDCEDTGTIT